MILLISHDLTPSGAPRALLELAKILKSAGEKLFVIALKGGELKKNFKELKIPVLTVKEKKILKFIFLLRFFKLIICNTIVTHKVVKKLSDKKFNVLWWLHEAWLFEDMMQKKSEEKRKEYIDAISSCKQIYCVSEYSKSFFEKYNSNVKVLNLYVEDVYKKFENVQKKENGKLNILYVGEFHPVKGQDRFLDYFSKLDSEIKKKIKVEFVGGRPYKDYLDTLKEKVTPDMDVEFLPQVTHSEIIQKLKESDVFALFSRGDSFSIATAEAMMTDIPVIISEEVGIKNIVEEEKAGYVIKNFEEFDCAIRKLVQNQNEGLNSSREAFLKYFSKENYTNYLKNILSECMH